MNPFRSPKMVTCPVCMNRWAWPDDDQLYLYHPSRAEPFRVSLKSYEGQDLLKSDEIGRGYQRCPNPSGDAEKHYLPASYVDHPDPLVIGLVGSAATGKTHLLTSILAQAFRDPATLRPYGLSIRPLDGRRHDRFYREFIRPFERGNVIPSTVKGITDYADMVLVKGDGPERPVIFFDVAGEDLESLDGGRVGRFLVGAHALVFVHGPGDVESGENLAFMRSLDRISRRTDAAALPVAVALMKADRLRYVPPADRWLRAGSGTPITAARFRAESRDVYAYMHAIGAGAWLTPLEFFDRCTLHFVSASGGDASGDEFPRGTRPLRVLEPLLAIFAMTGLISGSEAQKVGRP